MTAARLHRRVFYAASFRLAGVVFVFFALAGNAFAGRFADTLRPHIENRIIAGGVFLVADNEKILECEAAGMADIAAKKPMREGSVFWIASITKSFTAACVMMLVDDGKISLDDPVSKYIPAFSRPQKIVPKKNSAKKGEPQPAAVPNDTPITIRHLLSHTAGLGGEVPLWSSGLSADIFPLEKYVPLYARNALRFKPGTDHGYSDANTNVLGLVIEVASGRPYAVFMQERLLDPLGLADTTFWPAGGQLERLAKSYNSNVRKRILDVCKITALFYPLDNRANRHPIPSAGLFSTARDLAVFGQFLLNKGMHNGKRMLSEKSAAAMTAVQTPAKSKSKYGLGITILPDGFGHSGLYGTRFTVHPAENRVLVYMSQRRKPRSDSLGRKIFTELKTLVVPEKKQNDVPSK